REIAVGQLQHQVFAVLAEHIALLPALDDCCAVMGIHDLVSDVERHTSPRDETAGGQVPECQETTVRTTWFSVFASYRHPRGGRLVACQHAVFCGTGRRRRGN